MKMSKLVVLLTLALLGLSSSAFADSFARTELEKHIQEKKRAMVHRAIAEDGATMEAEDGATMEAGGSTTAAGTTAAGTTAAGTTTAAPTTLAGETSGVEVNEGVTAAAGEKAADRSSAVSSTVSFGVQLSTAEQQDWSSSVNSGYLKQPGVLSANTGVKENTRRQRLLAFSYTVTTNVVYTSIAAKTANSGSLTTVSKTVLSDAATAALPAATVASIDESSFTSTCATCTSGASSVALGAVLGFSAVFAALM
jgi:hypothetical protein